MRQASIRHDGGAALGAAHRQYLRVVKLIGAFQLCDALLLCPMNRQQAVEDFGIIGARILLFNQADQGPDRSLAIVLGKSHLRLAAGRETVH